MAGKSKIEWTERTWNPIVGCTIVSPGCTNCYAMRQASWRLDGNPKTPHYHGTTKTVNRNPVWTGKVMSAPESVWNAPLKLKRPAVFFVNSMGDLFHESVPDEWIDRAFAIMVLCPQHTFQVLTKRAERMRAYFRDQEARAIAIGPLADSADLLPLPNVWLGVSAEDQVRAEERIPLLLETPAAIRFVSFEPLLGAIDFRAAAARAMPKMSRQAWTSARLDWAIVGGESGPGARPMHPDWARSLRDECEAACVPFFFKQWGEHAPNGSGRYSMMKVGKRVAGRLLDGVEHNGMPEVQR